MDLRQDSHKIFTIQPGEFESMALEIFRFQYSNNPVYHDYVKALLINDAGVRSITQIPFLPISFFKSHSIKTGSFDPEIVFESSGTTTSVNSRHLVKDTDLYRRSFITGFELAYGPVKNWCIIGLLPSYLERGNSSLVYMVNELIRLSEHPQSGFYLDEFDKLSSTLQQLEQVKQRTLLVGVTFALLDFAEKYALPLKHTIVMETGGMKGRREEMVREEVHLILKRSFGLSTIHSEYGMTELLSQAYSKGDGIFNCPPWMKVLVRDEEDPLSVLSSESIVESREPASLRSAEMRGSKVESQKSDVTNLPIAIGTPLPTQGAINIIDLANLYSCSFIATDDAGRLHQDGSFEVMGRIDNSDVRGCSLMYDV
jgi:hypothetical protein